MSNTVKLSKATLEILQNYSSINTNILIQEGNKLATMAINKTILGEASSLTDVFPQEFPIYNLAELLNVISLFKEPSLEFNGKIVTVSEASGKGMKIKYMASSKDILVYPEKSVKEPPYEVNFELSAEDLNNILRSAAAINGPDIQIIGSGSGIVLKVTDKKVPTSNDVVLEVSDEPQDNTFTFNFRTENLKLIPGGYNISISSKLLSKFEHKEKAGLVWFLPLEKDSTFE